MRQIQPPPPAPTLSRPHHLKPQTHPFIIEG
jgi:hypothetical protein